MRMLCLGDSNTYGYDPRGFFGGRYGAGARWPDLLAMQTGWEVINAGANGRQIPCDPDAPQAVREYGPVDLLLVMLGTNDLLQGTSAIETAARMESFLGGLVPHCKRILLVAPPPMKRGAWVPSDELVTKSIRLAEEYKVLARKWDIPFGDTRPWNIQCAFDGVHFTEAGHQSFANHLFDLLCALRYTGLEAPGASLKGDFLCSKTK